MWYLSETLTDSQLPPHALFRKKYLISLIYFPSFRAFLCRRKFRDPRRKCKTSQSRSLEVTSWLFWGVARMSSLLMGFNSATFSGWRRIRSQQVSLWVFFVTRVTVPDQMTSVGRRDKRHIGPKAVSTRKRWKTREILFVKQTKAAMLGWLIPPVFSTLFVTPTLKSYNVGPRGQMGPQWRSQELQTAGIYRSVCGACSCANLTTCSHPFGWPMAL